jgi:GDP-L-fucose synthase
VTGASGFLGSHIARELGKHYAVDAPTRAELDLLCEDSVRDYLARNSVDAIVHAASARANRLTGAPPDLLDQNCRMFFNLIRNRDAFGRFLFLGSGAVYDRRQPTIRIREECFDRQVPADPYGFSKYICARSIAESLDSFELRLFGVFGPYEDWRVRFLSNACCRVVWNLPVVIRQNVHFDYLSVEDLPQVIRWFLEATPQHRAYNVCTGKTIDLLTIAQKIIAVSGKNLPITIKHDGLGPEYSGDNRRLGAEFPALRFRELDDSIAALYRWCQDHKATIDPRSLDFDA